MKVKCIKDTIGFKSGQIYESDRAESHITTFVNATEYQYCWKQLPEYFQEVKEEEENLPKWKVGSPVVHMTRWYENNFKDDLKYKLVHEIRGDSQSGYYYDTQCESAYRDPTPEELSLYFR